MQPDTQPRIILWSVNPFADDSRLIRRTAAVLLELAGQWQATVEPVYILQDVPPNVKLLPRLLADVQEQAREELRHLTRGLKWRGSERLKLLVSPSTRLRDQVQALSDYYRRRKASLLAVSTRARKGPRRWMMGSFAESLISEAELPLFVINPMERLPRRIQRILFPTDFSDESRDAFHRAIGVAQEMDVPITVFHRLQCERGPAYDAGYATLPRYARFHDDQFRLRTAQAEEWVRQAAARGVRAQGVVDHRTDWTIAEEIVSRSRSRGAIVMMAAHSGKALSGWLGGVTRQVVRSAECPVWVLQSAATAVATRPRKASGDH